MIPLQLQLSVLELVIVKYITSPPFLKIKSLIGGGFNLQERLGNDLSKTDELVFESFPLAEDGDASGAVTSVDGTSGTEDDHNPLFRS
ncbi:hypothetical protein TNCT_63761 [Trichonephila clavata]|uniref:Uncharacterized protein n=1 Tax=Trichonephila clavata TaxID=2740835 RepID=A0A8X6HY93_TRICU|nr:hypothetical protein TNCT_63761 [Trichonephila clavata]